ncbi:MAG: Sfum_1244 family protein [Gammaproteobacteria bacterium]
MPSRELNSIQALSCTVQRNCDISDAQFAGDYTLCTYLLKMKEYYRWSNGLGFDVTPKREDVGDWVEKREQLWDTLERGSYTPVVIDGDDYDAFDNDGINEALNERALVYSAGTGRLGKPHFFLGKLLNVEQLEGYRLLVSGEEYARDLTAPPAMARGRLIFVRRDALRRLLWESVEESSWFKREGALHRAMRCYNFTDNPRAALERMTENELESVIMHEIGEVVAGDLLGDGWHAMLSTVSNTRAEIVVRAVRDHLADCLSSLPALLTAENIPSLHFYFANLGAMRREIFPALYDAYQRWTETRNLQALKRAVRQGKDHWLAVGARIVEFHATYGDDCPPRIESYVAGKHL